MAAVHEFAVRRRVAFSETDMAGLAHFANFLRYAEDAEHALFRSLGWSIVTRLPDGRSLGWPRGGVSCRYFSPLRFEDEFEVRLLVRDITDKTITYAFEITALGDGAPRLCARGTQTAICVTGMATGAPKAVPIPQELRGRLEPAPAERLSAWDEAPAKGPTGTGETSP